MTCRPDVAGAASAAESVIGTLELNPSIDSLSEEGSKPKTCQGKIEFKDVQFSYPSRLDVKVFKSFSLTIKPGAVVCSLRRMPDLPQSKDKWCVVLSWLALKQQVHQWHLSVSPAQASPLLSASWSATMIRWTGRYTTKRKPFLVGCFVSHPLTPHPAQTYA